MDPMTMAMVGAAMTGAGALGQRSAQRRATSRRREHELEALRRDRRADEIRDRAARDAHAERSEGRQALLAALPDFAGDAKAQEARIADLLGEADAAAREAEAAGAGAGGAPLPEGALDAYERAQSVTRAKVDARGRQMDALRRAGETPADAALGTGRRLRGLGDVLGAAGGDARLAADAGASAAMPWETGARLHRGFGAQVRANPSLLSSIFSGVGPQLMGAGLAGAFTGGGGLASATQPPAPVGTRYVVGPRPGPRPWEAWPARPSGGFG